MAYRVVNMQSIVRTKSQGQSIQRCAWVTEDPLYLAYHDTEWGVPSHDDQHLFEMLVLEGAQAGLSWLTVLRKREAYRKAFDRFDPRKVAAYNKKKVTQLLANEGIIRNRLKIASAIRNAHAFLEIQRAFGSFDAYIWRFVDGAPKIDVWKRLKQIPCRSTESEAMSHDLGTRGFTFVGSTICYAFMQAVGLVNDHTTDCFRYASIVKTKDGQPTEDCARIRRR